MSELGRKQEEGALGVSQDLEYGECEETLEVQGVRATQSSRCWRRECEVSSRDGSVVNWFVCR